MERCAGLRVLVVRFCDTSSVGFFVSPRATARFIGACSFIATLLRAVLFPLERELVVGVFFTAFLAFTGAFFFSGGADLGFVAAERFAGAFFFAGLVFFTGAFFATGFLAVFTALRALDFLAATFFATVVSFFFVAMIGVLRRSPSVMPMDVYLRDSPRNTGNPNIWHGMHRAGSGVEVPHWLGIG